MINYYSQYGIKPFSSGKRGSIKLIAQIRNLPKGAVPVNILVALCLFNDDKLKKYLDISLSKKTMNPKVSAAFRQKINQLEKKFEDRPFDSDIFKKAVFWKQNWFCTITRILSIDFFFATIAYSDHKNRQKAVNFETHRSMEFFKFAFVYGIPIALVFASTWFVLFVILIALIRFFTIVPTVEIKYYHHLILDNLEEFYND